jgi:hypothetical protein
MYARPGGLLVVSCGGYRSGSTYCYNLLGEYVERANTGRRIGYVEPSQVPLLAEVWSFLDAMGSAVAKSHNSPGTDAGAECWPTLMADAATPVAPVCTVRDFRDVLHSFSRKFGESPEDVLRSRRWEINLSNLRWWLAAGAVRIAYEDLLDAPAKTLAETLTAIGIDPHTATVDAAVAAASLPEVSDVAAGLADAGVDRRTLLHADHVGDPTGGGWRRWDAERLATLRPALEPLLEEFGYVW